MSKRRLPNQDIVEISTLPERNQFERLRAKRDFAPPHSLETVRRNMHSLLGVKTPIDNEQKTSDERLLQELRRACKRAKDVEPCLARGRALLALRRSEVDAAVEAGFREHRITIDNRISLTHSLALRIDGRGVIPFFDLRKSGSLSARGRDFLFSMNYHLIVDAQQDFREFDLAIFDYWENPREGSGFSRHLFSGSPRYSYEELSDMIARTYQIWLEILEERKASQRHADDSGPLFRQA